MVLPWGVMGFVCLMLYDWRDVSMAMERAVEKGRLRTYRPGAFNSTIQYMSERYKDPPKGRRQSRGKTVPVATGNKPSGCFPTRPVSDSSFASLVFHRDKELLTFKNNHGSLWVPRNKPRDGGDCTAGNQLLLPG